MGITILFWSLVVFLIIVGFFAAIFRIADAALPRFLRKTGPAGGATTVGVLATIANGLGKIWGAVAAFGGLVLVVMQLKNGWSGFGIFGCILLLSLGADVLLGTYKFRRIARFFIKNRAIAAASLATVLVIGVFADVLFFNPSAGWYPMQVRTLDVPTPGGKTENVRVVPTPSGGFFRAVDVFGEFVLKNLITTTKETDGIVLLDTGLAPHVPGYDLKYTPVEDTPFVRVFIKGSWKENIQDSYAKKGVREYRSVSDLANISAPGPMIGPTKTPVSPAAGMVVVPSSQEGSMNVGWLILAILSSAAVIGLLVWWAAKRPAGGDRWAWGILIALATIFSTFAWGKFASPTVPAQTYVAVPTPPAGPTRVGDNSGVAPVPDDLALQRNSLYTASIKSPIFDGASAKGIVDVACNNPKLAERFRQAAGCEN